MKIHKQKNITLLSVSIILFTSISAIFVNFANADIYIVGNENDEPPEDNNSPPIAHANGPYFGIENVPIVFNGTNSVDFDGTIESYKWNFDYSTSNSGGTRVTISFVDTPPDTGKILSHTYNKPGNYTVTLTVTDNNGSSDTDITYALISAVPNIPPSIPIIEGKTILKINKIYSFSAYSYNNDSDLLRYNFSWGDKTFNQTDFVDNGTTVDRIHSWNNIGIYNITVTVTDENNAMSSNTLKVYVGVTEFIKDEDFEGYLFDRDADGTYDIFYSNETVLKLKDGKYMIDVNDDGIWDYIYNPSNEEITSYGEEDIIGFISDRSLFLILISVIVILFLVLIGKIIISKKSLQIIGEEKKRKKPKKHNHIVRGLCPMCGKNFESEITLKDELTYAICNFCGSKLKKKN